MQYFIVKKIFFSVVAIVASCSFVYAAKITIDTPSKNATNRNPVTVHIVLDAENDTLSGISGNFSFPSELYTLSNILIESSIVSLWALQPAVTDEKYLDGRTHIVFEGVFPGGYSGVKSAYYAGVRGGVVFSATLIPKNKGKGVLLVDDINLHAYDSNATALVTTSAIHVVEIPDLPNMEPTSAFLLKEIQSPTLSAFITRDELVNNNAWYLMIHEREQKSSQEKIYISESDIANPNLLDEYSWRSEHLPYVLLFQDRTKYVHVKVFYADHTYTLRTLVPVENSQSISRTSRILLGIALALFVLYLYVIFSFTPFSQHPKNTP